MSRWCWLFRSIAQLCKCVRTDAACILQQECPPRRVHSTKSTLHGLPLSTHLPLTQSHHLNWKQERPSSLRHVPLLQLSYSNVRADRTAHGPNCCPCPRQTRKTRTTTLLAVQLHSIPFSRQMRPRSWGASLTIESRLALRSFPHPRHVPRAQPAARQHTPRRAPPGRARPRSGRRC